ncbi:type III-B CRISPR module RAMP protein Cmr4 [Thermodesulfobacterium thermophilum]|uniref:type III-B CRISPR module RAMP protein Cmr4 n=1 Tax=Thermodesulfobacterium thermophilum TaxID=886 RepID=UPI0003B68162|nr:type III-B CRISPR module RAMP protein Cmr4 [Thermodesulfobacterium thermophilum]
MSNLAVFYHFYTSLHFGSGTTLSYIDLPVERESHTNYPVMPSTGIKGVFRACYQQTYGEEKAESIFGKGDEEGKLTFVDGRILFFPVKSARGVFVWITCPMVLQRFERDMKIIKSDFKINFLASLNFDNDEVAYVSSDRITVNDFLILEELSLKKKNNIDFNWIDQLKIGIDKSRIAVISDNMFSYFVKNATEINARIRIDQEKGTVEEGALWYEELVPAESVFYSLVIERSKDSCKDLQQFIKTYNNQIFQFGGNETLGRGFAKVILYGGEKNG